MRGTYLIQPDGTLRGSQEQLPLTLRDQFYGEPNQSSLKYENDLAPFKPLCDVIVNGTAYAPAGKPVPRFEAAIILRQEDQIILQKRLAVSGPRFWLRRPQPIASLPLKYEFAYGGPDVATNYVGMSVPQIEAVSAPGGLGIVSKTWQPRLGKAGTYNEEWQKARHPYLPDDFDPAFWNAAPADQQVPWLSGREQVELENLSPNGKIVFDLPGVLVYALVRYQSGDMIPTPMNIDTLLIEPDERRVTMVWRLRIQEEPEIRVLEARLVKKQDQEVQQNLREMMKFFTEIMSE